MLSLALKKKIKNKKWNHKKDECFTPSSDPKQDDGCEYLSLYRPELWQWENKRKCLRNIQITQEKDELLNFLTNNYNKIIGIAVLQMPHSK